MSDDVQYKPGHKVYVMARQVDENGLIISEEEAEWFGFSNDDANTFHMALVQGTYAVADQFREAKKNPEGGQGRR